MTTSGTSAVVNGLSITDWITALATLAVAFFTVVTLWDDWKKRKVQSAEKQLEKLYNPVFEILDKAANQQTAPQKARQVLVMNSDDYTKLWEILLMYGYYLGQEEHDSLKTLLLSPVTLGPIREYVAVGFLERLEQIRARRDKLKSSL